MKNKKVVLTVGSGALAIGTLTTLLILLSSIGVIITSDGDKTCGADCTSYIYLSNFTKDVVIKNISGLKIDFSSDPIEYDLLLPKDIYPNYIGNSDYISYKLINSYTFKKGVNYTLILKGKKNPSETIKWGFGIGDNYVDPLWNGMTTGYTQDDYFKFVRTEVNFNNACSYYQIINPSPATIVTLDNDKISINNTILVIGNLSFGRWYILNYYNKTMIDIIHNISYVNYTCINGTMACRNMTDNATYINITVNETKWEELIKIPTLTPNVIRDIRYCANITRKNLAVSIDTIPTLTLLGAKYTFPQYAWWNDAYTYKNNISCGNMTDLPFLINGTNGIMINDNKQLIWSICRPNMSIYYNATNIAIIENGSVQIPHEIDSNGTALNHYNPTSVWGTCDWVYHGNNKSSSASVQRDLTCTNMGYTSNTTGIIGSSFNSTGAGGYCGPAQVDNPNFNRSNVSFIVLAKPTALSNYKVIFSINDAPAPYDSIARWQLGSSSGYTTFHTSAGTAPNDDGWSETSYGFAANANNFLAMDWNGTQSRIIVNKSGAYNASLAGTYRINQTAYIYLGSDVESPGRDYPGMLDEFRLCDSYTRSQLRYIYENMRPLDSAVTGIGELAAREENVPVTPDINVTLSTGIGRILYRPYFGTLPIDNLEPVNQTSVIGLFNIINNGTGTGSLRAKENDTYTNVYTECSCVYFTSERYNLTTSYQTLCSLAASAQTYVWCRRDYLAIPATKKDISINFTIV